MRSLFIATIAFALASSPGLASADDEGYYAPTPHSRGGRPRYYNSPPPPYHPGYKSGYRSPPYNSGYKSPPYNSGYKSPAYKSGSKSPPYHSGYKSPSHPTPYYSQPEEECHDTLHMPGGVVPDGVVLGKGDTYYASNLADGAILKGSFENKSIKILVDGGNTNGQATGMCYDDESNLLFVAGGSTGYIDVYDGESGVTLMQYDLRNTQAFGATPQPPPSSNAGDNLMQDCAITKDGVIFTLALTTNFVYLPYKRGGSLPDNDQIRIVDYTGSFTQPTGSTGFNFGAGGIQAISDYGALIMTGGTAEMYHLDLTEGASLGVTTKITIAGPSTFTTSNGLLLNNKTGLMYVSQNQDNKVHVLQMSRDFKSASYKKALEASRNPSNMVIYDKKLYTANTRFSDNNFGNQLSGLSTEIGCVAYV